MTVSDSQHDPAVGVPLPRVLQVFWAGSALAFVLTWLIAFLEYRAGWERLRWSPLLYQTWGDLVLYTPTFKLLHTAAFYHTPNVEMISYPPLGAALLALLYSFGHPVGFYLAVAVPALAFTVWRGRVMLLREGISSTTATLFPLTLVLTSFPVARLVPQGNIELFVWIFVVVGIVTYLRGYDDPAAVFWGLAAATKLYPVLFLVLFLPRRNYRAVLVGIGSIVMASILSMLYLGPDLATAFRGSMSNIFGYQGSRASAWDLREVIANHSTFTLVKFFSLLVRHSMSGLVLPYTLCGALLFVAIFFGRVRKMPATNQLLVVSLFMVMFPTISYYHTLVHLYAPWTLLVLLVLRSERAGVPVPGLQATVLMFFPLFVSATLYTAPAVFLFGGLLQAAWLVVLFFKVVALPLEEPSAVVE